ncbi:glypican-5a isoform X2 [Lepisosteus oculatus]|uniref:glypican-5a isoform X2 n=1 Tax=Lepisosteus oculatus TaxID=7918 RepID=UPI0007400E3A|nr:PREDICTED: glypican-5 isoform X2 [Lepisosteus oculatus]
MGPRRLFCCLVLAVFFGLSLESPTSCDEVRKVFELRQIGPVKSLPEFPITGSDLQVCTSRNVTCCTKKMEEKYQVAARHDIQHLLQTSSSSLKFLISRNVAAFQETFETLIRHAENHTNTLFRTTYRNMAADAAGSVKELFTDVGLFVLGSEVSVEDFVNRFFDSLFPLVYNHLINPGLTDITINYAECIRMTRRDLNPFGNFPKLAVGQIGRSMLPGRVFLQALNLGIEVINTTDHLQYTKECKRALLKMQYCPHCQGLTQSKPCMGYCLNVIRGCLANMAEIDSHWREYVRSLEEVSNSMHGSYDVEQVLLNLHSLVNDAIMHAQINGPKLSVQVHKMCGHPNRKSAQSSGSPLENAKDLVSLKVPPRNTEESLASRRKEFINSLRLYQTFYAGLADHLCVSELASSDGLSCWNGADVVKSYTLRVVGNGIKAQMANPEVKVKGTDPLINQIIDKLKHINQLLQGKSIPKYGSLDLIETGSGNHEGQISGDCDDEDGCSGSGSGEMNKVLQVTKPLWCRQPQDLPFQLMPCYS